MERKQIRIKLIKKVFLGILGITIAIAVGIRIFEIYKSSKATLVIPEGVETINKSQYNGKYVKKVIIPNSVTSIEDGAFDGWESLTDVVWNAKFSSSDNSPFYSISTQITSFVFGEDVEYIPAYLCYEMSKLTAITIPKSVTSIGGYAFYGCEGLTSVTIPNSVTSIGKDAFRGCSNLTSIVWNAKKCTDFSSSDNSPFHSISTQITSFVFGEDVEHIPAYLCYEMSKLTAITIPKSVKSIGEQTFCWCNSLTAVHISDIASWCSIDFGSHNANPSANLYLNGELVTDLIIIPEAVKTIKSYAFSYCKSLTSVTIPNSVTSIGDGVFYGCGSLTSVTIGNSVISIGKGAFYNCRSLTSITIPNSVTSIGEFAFSLCSSLTSVTIPNSVESIEDFVFLDCSSLTSITIHNSITSIGDYAFSGCSSLTTIYNYAEIPQNIDSNVFSGVDKSTCTLYVPANSIKLYKTTKGWKNFSNIKPIRH